MSDTRPRARCIGCRKTIVVGGESSMIAAVRCDECMAVGSGDSPSEYANDRQRRSASGAWRDPVSAALRELRDAPGIVTSQLHTAPRDGVLFEAFDTSDAERGA